MSSTLLTWRGLGYPQLRGHERSWDILNSVDKRSLDIHNMKEVGISSGSHDWNLNTQALFTRQNLSYVDIVELWISQIWWHERFQLGLQDESCNIPSVENIEFWITQLTKHFKKFQFIVFKMKLKLAVLYA